MKKSFNIQELLHHKSKHHESKLMHPSSSRAFQKNQGRNLKHPSSMDLISTKQNKETSSGQQTSEWMKERVSKAYHEWTRRKEEQRRENVKFQCLLGLCATCRILFFHNLHKFQNINKTFLQEFSFFV